MKNEQINNSDKDNCKNRLTSGNILLESEIVVELQQSVDGPRVESSFLPVYGEMIEDQRTLSSFVELERIETAKSSAAADDGRKFCDDVG